MDTFHVFVVSAYWVVYGVKWCCMHFATFLTTLLALSGTIPENGVAQSTSDVDAFIETQGPIAKAGVLANIGLDGPQSQEVKAGLVIASPSKSDPDYFFTWTRDSSLVFKMLIDQYTSGIDSSSLLRGHIDDFVQAEADLQQVSNPSGTITTGGLGEPKFNVDGSAFTGPWGRPQRDGPALRATAMIAYANWHVKNSNVSFASDVLWPVIQRDLDYVALNWNFTTFDLWEEVNSASFFTATVQHRALREGLALSESLSITSSAATYPAQADNLLCFLQSFWSPPTSSRSAFITANTGGGRSGIDANTLLASIHTFDPTAGCDETTFQPCSDRALANLATYVNAFKSIYTINNGVADGQAVATGRYPEDVYMGGNPWYLATFAVAEQLYDALAVWSAQESLSITSVSQPFFSLFSSSTSAPLVPGDYAASTPTFSAVTSAVKAYADAYLLLARKYTPGDGSLAEQYSRGNGQPLSAANLTWSYASAITAFQARSGDNIERGGWGAQGLNVPSECRRANEGPGGSTVQVTFNVIATTVFGENIYITGSVDALQDWSPDSALLLSSANYPTWSITVQLPPGTIVQYKYIRKFNGAVTWESDPNNQITTGASGSMAVTINDTWR